MNQLADLLSPPFEGTLATVLRTASEREPARPVFSIDGRLVTIAELWSLAEAAAAELERAGVRAGDTILAMLGNGLGHVALFLGAALAGCIYAGVNPLLRGPSLRHCIAVARPRLIFAGPDAMAALKEVGPDVAALPVQPADGWAPRAAGKAFDRLAPSAPDDVRAILFTSGTSGPPKGVQVTERMLLASAAGCALASDCRSDDAYLMWEPMHHIGGPQLLVMALVHGSRLVLVPRFSASAFWQTARVAGVTNLHYLGGILDILLKARPQPDDRQHQIRVAFGGGCRRETWQAFEARFGIPLREVYGMTEASSFTTINVEGLRGSVGRQVPWFEVAVVDQAGARLPAGEIGEITVRSLQAGLFTPGYRDNPEATARLLRGDRLFTGDIGRMDAAGNLVFLGRRSDTLRRRGENISAWEVETALAAHPDIAECAVAGVEAAIGEQDIMAFVLLREGAAFVPEKLAEWSRANLTPHHVPRWWKRVGEFPRTPSERIRKDALDRGLSDAVDTAPARDR